MSGNHYYFFAKFCQAEFAGGFVPDV